MTVDCCTAVILSMVDTFLTFFVTMASRELFIWKRKHEAPLPREVFVEEPYRYRPGSKERNCMDQESGMKVTKRSVRERFDTLFQREREEGRTGGVDVQYDEIYQALTDVNDQIVGWEEQQQRKEESEKGTAKEMRKRATEKLSERKQQNNTDDDDNSDGTTPKKRKSVTELLERSIERKAHLTC